METAGIEPASAIAQKVASTSVSGALISSPTRHAGGVVGDQLQRGVPGLAGASRPGRACQLIPETPPQAG